MERLDTTARIETPERVWFRYRVAGPGRRAAAWLIDAVVSLVFVVMVGLALLLLAWAPGLLTASIGFYSVLLFFVQWFYGVFFEVLFSGRTPGKYFLSLRVVREDGSPVRLQDSVLRNFLRTADFLPIAFGLGLLTMLLDRKLRRLGDLAAGTLVVVEERAAVLGKVAIEPPVSDAERQSLPARVDLTREERIAIENFLSRRRTLSRDRADELARYLAPAISERTGVQSARPERVLALAYARHMGRYQ